MKSILLAVMAAVLVSVSSFAATEKPSVDGLITKLVEKGVISEAEAKELKEDLKKAAPSKPEHPFEVKVRGQVRFDTGDLLINDDGRYETENDLFLRRARVEIEKKFEKPPFGKELEINITLDADRSEQDLRGGEREEPNNDVELRYLYGDWMFSDQFAVKLGKHKLPFSRISLTSSSRQLLIERPAATEAAKDALGDYQQAQIQIHGELWDGSIGYYAAYGDGVNNLDTVRDLDSDADDVQKNDWGSAYIGRLEISPIREKKKDDTGIGEQNHLTLGINGGIQNKVKYTTASISDASLDTIVMGADVAARYNIGGGAVTVQIEYVSFKKDFSYKDEEEPSGYYGQAGYLLPGTILDGRLEPALRYELFDHDTVETEGRSGTEEKSYTLGFNHYLSKHSIKWSYNMVLTKFDEGVAEAVNDRTRRLHQLMMQLYF